MSWRLYNGVIFLRLIDLTMREINSPSITQHFVCVYFSQISLMPPLIVAVHLLLLKLYFLSVFFVFVFLNLGYCWDREYTFSLLFSAKDTWSQVLTDYKLQLYYRWVSLKSPNLVINWCKWFGTFSPTVTYNIKEKTKTLKPIRKRME